MYMPFGEDRVPRRRASSTSCVLLLRCLCTAAHIVDSVDTQKVILRNVFDDRLSTREGIDLIVDWPGCQANDALINDWEEHALEVVSIGDCRAPRTVEVAISEAAAAAKAL